MQANGYDKSGEIADGVYDKKGSQPQYGQPYPYPQQAQPAYLQEPNGAGMAQLETGGFLGEDYERTLRRGFIRKVYMLLSLLMVLTVGIICAMLFTPGSTLFFYERRWLIWVAFIPMIVLLFVLLRYKDRHPLNLVLLFTFAVVESFLIGIICASYQEQGVGDIIVISFGVTMGTFLGLTIFTLQSKIDWSFLATGLYAGMWCLIIWAFLVWLFGFRTSFLFSLAGALLFCGFIVYDTNNVAKKYNVDQYIAGAIALYLDIVNLFLCVLSMGRRSR